MSRGIEMGSGRGQVVRIGVVTDIHATAENWPDTQRLLERVLETFAEQNVACVVELGDRINEASPEADREMVCR
ncbi:MAG TPA: hypothetical protein VIK93_04685, partial [Limnochordales bacterium]